jgi:repressor LexA
LCYNAIKEDFVMDHLIKVIKVGERIRQARINAKLTQDNLAKLVGYTPRSSINKIEKGLVDIPRSKIIKIADVLGVPPAFLCLEKKNNLPSPTD